MTRRTWLLLFLFTGLSAGRLMAQAVSGTIVGTVVDQSGAVVADAPVAIILTGQNTTYATVTNESGNFTEPNLPPGNYTVTVAATGLKRWLTRTSLSKPISPPASISPSPQAARPKR